MKASLARRAGRGAAIVRDQLGVPAASAGRRRRRRRLRGAPASRARRRRRPLARCRRRVGRVVGRRRAPACRSRSRRGARRGDSRLTRRGPRCSRTLSSRSRRFVVVGLEERFPPVGELGLGLAGLAAQAQEVEAGAKARLLEQRQRASCRVRRSKRGCISQISRMSAASLPRPGDVADARVEDRVDRLPAAPGTAPRPRPVRCCQPSSTSCQSMQASMKLGATGLPSATRRRCRPAPGARTSRAPSWRCASSSATSSTGKTPRCRPCFFSSTIAGQRMAGLQQLDHLVEGARRRHVVEQRRHLLDRRARLRLDLEAELGGEAHDADDAHRVLAVARGRVADHAQQLLLRVLDAAVVVDHDLASPGRSTSR